MIMTKKLASLEELDNLTSVLINSIKMNSINVKDESLQEGLQRVFRELLAKISYENPEDCVDFMNSIYEVQNKTCFEAWYDCDCRGCTVLQILYSFMYLAGYDIKDGGHPDKMRGIRGFYIGEDYIVRYKSKFAVNLDFDEDTLTVSKNTLQTNYSVSQKSSPPPPKSKSQAYNEILDMIAEHEEKRKKKKRKSIHHSKRLKGKLIK